MPFELEFRTEPWTIGSVTAFLGGVILMFATVLSVLIDPPIFAVGVFLALYLTTINRES